MANSKYSYYFTVVIYEEFTRLHKLLELGSIYQSPIHYSCQMENLGTSSIMAFPNINELCLGKSIGHKKPHRHLLLKTANSYTENTFVEKLVKLLDNDLTGISIHLGDVLVKKPELMIRYFYHLDNPIKEHFNLENAFQDVMPAFSKEVAKAFEVEITQLIKNKIYNGEFCGIQDILLYYDNSFVLNEFLRVSHNLYLVNSIIKDYRFLIQQTF